MTTRALVVLIASIIAIPACKRRVTAGSDIKESFDAENDPYQIVGAQRVPYDRAIAASAKLAEIPWAGYYWATYRGGIAYRWPAHEGVAAGVLANASYREFLYEPMSAEVASNLGTDQIAALSPAEKYDLLASSGGGGFPVTRAQQNRTRAAAGPANGEVPTWFGICHGWAPAAALESRPGLELRIPNQAGQCITFYRADLEGLASQFYADANFDTGFLGSRCNVAPTEIPRRADGRIDDRACRDVNPAALHLALGTLVGGGVSFVADVTYSDEVWNQPIYAYRVSYGASVPIGSTSDSSPRGDRAATATSIVPVTTEMDYVVESSPTRSDIDLKRFIKTVVYRYTLEIDAQGYIVGGEWDPSMTANPQAKWPDFLWQARHHPSGDVSGLNYERIHSLIEKSRSNGGRAVDLCANGSGGSLEPAPPRIDHATGRGSASRPDPAPIDGSSGTDSGSGASGQGDGKPWPALRARPQATRPATLPTVPEFVSEPTRPWLPPFDPKWNPKGDFCSQQAGEQGCNRAQSSGNGCGWSLGVKRCLNVRSKVCRDYPDRQWCELGSGYRCEWNEAKRACIYTGPTVKQAQQSVQGGRP